MSHGTDIDSDKASADARLVGRSELQIAFIGIGIGSQDPAPWIVQVLPDGESEKRRPQFRLATPPGRAGIAGWWSKLISRVLR